MQYLILFIIILLLTTYFSSIETSLISSSKSRVKTLKESGDNTYNALYEELKNRTEKISSLRLVIISGVVFGSFVFVKFIYEIFQDIIAKSDVYVSTRNIVYLSYLIGLILAVFIFYTFEYLIAKRFGLNNPDKRALNSIKTMKIVTAIMKPFVVIDTFIANTIVRLFGIDPSKLDIHITEDEIRMMVDAGSDIGSIDENEMEMINNIFEFDNTSVEDIATHRTNIVAIPITSTLEGIKKVIVDEKYSRIPVYEENIDNIIGILYVKDFIKYIFIDELGKNFNLKNILMEPYFIPTSKKSDELFKEMQIKKVHMAIVIDEYGGTTGIVTMEDLLEEIVGNIFDEYDVEEKEDIEIINEDTYIIKGGTDINDVEEFLNVKFEDISDYDTLGGYLIGKLGRVPDDNERPEIDICGYNFKIIEFDDKRINLVKVNRV
ncbi:MAG: HlyC/CorC family transporter [Tyzzerella sp.]|uniref:HlyC/CorC family transporter n=1 Tax=Candidatus Fimicola merdigallinarum TaxID=2840819 RepID=A0A9D9DY79_9FIRM|nr:HlyC/CorC family transporter [Candidatus Fimicola merdigallinarum]